MLKQPSQVGRKNPCITGFYKHHVKKVCQFFFGDFFSRVDVDDHNKTFNIRVHRSLNIPVQYEIKKEILSRIIELTKQGKQIDEIKKIVELENSFTSKAEIENFVQISDFKNFWGPQWKLIYESKEIA